MSEILDSDIQDLINGTTEIFDTESWEGSSVEVEQSLQKFEEIIALIRENMESCWLSGILSRKEIWEADIGIKNIRESIGTDEGQVDELSLKRLERIIEGIREKMEHSGILNIVSAEDIEAAHGEVISIREGTLTDREKILKQQIGVLKTRNNTLREGKDAASARVIELEGRLRRAETQSVTSREMAENEKMNELNAKIKQIEGYLKEFKGMPENDLTRKMKEDLMALKNEKTKLRKSYFCIDDSKKVRGMPYSFNLKGFLRKIATDTVDNFKRKRKTQSNLGLFAFEDLDREERSNYRYWITKLIQDAVKEMNEGRPDIKKIWKPFVGVIDDDTFAVGFNHESKTDIENVLDTVLEKLPQVIKNSKPVHLASDTVFRAEEKKGYRDREEDPFCLEIAHQAFSRVETELRKFQMASQELSKKAVA